MSGQGKGIYLHVNNTDNSYRKEMCVNGEKSIEVKSWGFTYEEGPDKGKGRKQNCSWSSVSRNGLGKVC